MDDFSFLHSSFENFSSSQRPSGAAPQIILVEDDQVLGKTLKKFFEKSFQIDVLYFENIHGVIEALSLVENKNRPFCLITDISLEFGGSGLHLIDQLKEMGLKFVSIAITGFASVETAIDATKKGVYHYLTKPFELEDLKRLVVKAFKERLGLVVGECLDDQEQINSVRRLNKKLLEKFKIEPPGADDIFCGMIGRSQKMKEVFEKIKKVSMSQSTILVNGPSGTGKELVANAIHKFSDRRSGNMVSVNCGAIPGELLESELFGHVKGAFTGAISNRRGRFEIANGGTIFLDEIGDMPLHLQVKLLRVLQNKKIEPVGGQHCIDIDVRIITATHRDLEKSVQDGKFREDLYYRLNVIPIKIPALKERREDIPLLISYFLNRFSSADGSNSIKFTDESMEQIMCYDWPGNVRELENLIERLVILRGGNTIHPEELPAKIFRSTSSNFSPSIAKNIFELPQDGIDLKEFISEIEDSLILQALQKTSGNKNQASKLLNLNRTTLIEKMKKKNIEMNLN